MFSCILAKLAPDYSRISASLDYSLLASLQTFHLLLTCYSSMVPGILPSQLDILSMGQTYFETFHLLSFAMVADLQLTSPCMLVDMHSSGNYCCTFTRQSSSVLSAR